MKYRGKPGKAYNGSYKAAPEISTSVSCSCGLLRSPVASEFSFIILNYATILVIISATYCALLPLASRWTLLSFVSPFMHTEHRLWLLKTGHVSRFVTRATSFNHYQIYACYYLCHGLCFASTGLSMDSTVVHEPVHAYWRPFVITENRSCFSLCNLRYIHSIITKFTWMKIYLMKKQITV